MFGGDPVDVGDVKPGTGNRDDWNVPSDNPIDWKPLSGCRFRPMSTKEKLEYGAESSAEMWRLTSPPHQPLLDAKSTSLIRHKGRIYDIDGGIRPFTDASGAPFKVTVICSRQQVETS